MSSRAEQSRAEQSRAEQSRATSCSCFFVYTFFVSEIIEELALVLFKCERRTRASFFVFSYVLLKYVML